ncbi:MAG: hypothetical protein ACYCZQ_13785 [Burkholderiales bacterium]
MNEYSEKNISAFFDAISPWRRAYGQARLNYLATRRDDRLLLLSARLYFVVTTNDAAKPQFRAGSIVAGQWDIPQEHVTVEEIVASLLSADGLQVEGHGRLMLAHDAHRDVSASAPMLLHPEGINEGNRLAVLSISGANLHSYFTQPDTDWLLKAAEVPFDSINELSIEYGLGALRGDLAVLEVVALNAVQVSVRSVVQGTVASLGVWMASGLDQAKARLGYRIVDKGKVVQRGAVSGKDLSWESEGDISVGMTSITVAAGAVVHCIASYEGHAHHLRWLADPSVFQNPRAAVLSSVDQTGELLRSYLLPELPPKGKAADDFEAAISWLIWVLGFAPAIFGLHPKTRDAFDIAAVSPRGDFLVVECTLGLLKSDSKLSKLAARAASLRETLDESNMRHLQILPVIVTAMTKEQVKGEMIQAEEMGILVLTRENLDLAFDELLRFPDADGLFDRAIRALRDNKTEKMFE